MKYDCDIVVDYYKDHGISLVPEFKFSPDRDFRWDFAVVPDKIAIEVQGGIWKGKRGGHTSGPGYKRDMEKQNLGAALGWRVIQCEPKDICMSDTLEIIQKTLEVTRAAMTNTLSLTLDPTQAVFLAGSILLMLHKHSTNEFASKQHVQGLATEVLKNLSDAAALSSCSQDTEHAITAALDAADTMTESLLMPLDELETLMQADTQVYLN